ncbi:uroporphyrinogen decarboxylase [Gammaproteobacteria bacterium]
MPPDVNDRLLRVLRHQPVDYTPIWLMRQAGRYLPEYRKTRERAGDFLTLCKTPELACEVTLQPITRFPLDAAILFSDILTIPDAMGLGLYFVEGEGPRFQKPVRTLEGIQTLRVPDPERDLGYVTAAVRLIRHELADRIPLIGFAGSPWTLATYMVEGGASKEFRWIKTLLYDYPQSLLQLLNILTEAVSTYLIAQISAGAQVVMLFDTWGGVLTSQDYLRFSLSWMANIVQRVKTHAPQVPIILFTKGGGAWLENIASVGCDAIGLDWTVDLQKARERVGNQVALQGNLDPAILYASPKSIQSRVADVLAGYGHGDGHVFNLGHGISPEVPPEHVAALVEAVHEKSRAYHSNE